MSHCNGRQHCIRCSAVPFSDAEVVAAANGRKVTADEIVAAVRPRGRQRVPDHVKAELLSELRSAILKQ